MRIALIASMVLIAGLTFFLAIEFNDNSKLSAQVKSLNEKLTNNAGAALVQLRERCADQAEKSFHQMGYSENMDSPYQGFFRNHYNAKLGKCFVAIESTKSVRDKVFTNQFLLDAFENRKYAEFIREFPKPPVLCKLIAHTNDEKFCKSEDEYKAFVDRYME